MTEINQSIFLGNYYNSNNLQELKQRRTTHILNCAEDIQNNFPEHFKYLKINAIDSPQFDLSIYLHQMADFIHECVSKKGVILVHCAMGISRSSTAVIAYYVKYQGWTVNKALKMLQEKRECVCPNEGFMKQLQNFQLFVKQSKSVKNIVQKK